jgi:hypothetical protein
MSAPKQYMWEEVSVPLYPQYAPLSLSA